MACTAKTRLPTAELAQKLRWRKATKSNFCDKVFVGYEALLHAVFLPEIKLSSSIFIKKEEIYIFEATLLFEQPNKATNVASTAALFRPKV